MLHSYSIEIRFIKGRACSLWAAWPEAGIKISPNISQSCPNIFKSRHSSSYLKRGLLFQNSPYNLGYFCKKLVPNSFQKLPNLVILVVSHHHCWAPSSMLLRNKASFEQIISDCTSSKFCRFQSREYNVKILRLRDCTSSQPQITIFVQQKCFHRGSGCGSVDVVAAFLGFFDHYSRSVPSKRTTSNHAE